MMEKLQMDFGYRFLGLFELPLGGLKMDNMYGRKELIPRSSLGAKSVVSLRESSAKV